MEQNDNTEKDSNSLNELPLEKTAEPLDEDLYWKIVDQSLKDTSTQDEQEAHLINAISTLTPKQMIGFRLRTDILLFESYTSEMWCAGWLMNDFYCSDDDFEYFRNWVISRGKDTYYKAKENPDYLVNEIVEGRKYYDFESFWYVALQAFEDKTGEELYDYIDEENFILGEDFEGIDFNWEKDDPESMRKICPQLFAKMNALTGKFPSH